MKNSLAIFEKFKIRRHFDEESQKWFFSVVDVVAALTEQHDFLKARKYWNKLKERLVKEGSQLVTNCHQFKIIAEDEKMRATDVADLETIFRLKLVVMLSLSKHASWHRTLKHASTGSA